ncbi:MAG: autotransporter translocation and assembly factor TamB [Dasania sp.]|jgi:autotransporter translocation and assembly factor TamB
MTDIQIIKPQKKSWLKKLIRHLMVNPLSAIFNGLLYCVCLIGLLFFSANLRNDLIQNKILPVLEHFNVPKVTYDNLAIDNNQNITGSNITLYDGKKEKFLHINDSSIKASNLFDIMQGFKKIQIDTLTLFKKPFFETSKPQKDEPNKKPQIPVIPFNINTLNVNRLILKSKFTHYKQDLAFKITGKMTGRADENQNLKINISSYDFKNASLNAAIKHQNGLIKFDTKVQAPAHLVNDLIKNPYFKGTLATAIKGSLSLKPYLKNPKKPIIIDINTFQLNDAKQSISGTLKTHLTPDPLKLDKTNIQLKSGSNMLEYQGSLGTKSINGTLKANNFNVIDFYPINPDLAFLTLNGALDIKGNLDKIPTIQGAMKIATNYQSMPFTANINGNYVNGQSTLHLDATSNNKTLVNGDIRLDSQLDNQQAGTVKLLLNSKNLPLKLRRQLPVILSNVDVSTNFKQTPNSVIFSNGHLEADKIQVKKSISNMNINLANIIFNFDNTPDALNITKAALIAKINQQTYNITLNANLSDYYKPKNLNFQMINQANAQSHIKANVTYRNNKELINLSLNQFNPNFLLPTGFPININEINANFKGDANVFDADPLSTLNGLLSATVKHKKIQNKQASIALETKINQGNLDGLYNVLMNGKSAGNGTVKTQNNFSAIKINAKLDLSALSQFIQNTEHRLTGNMLADVTLNQGAVSGAVGINNGTYRNLLYGTELDNITLDSTVSPDYININALSATAPNKGTINGKGIISLSPTQQSTLTLNTNRLSPLKDDIVSVKVDSIINLTGTINNLNLTGDITLNDLLILLPDIEANNTPTLNIVRPSSQQAKPEADTVPLLERVKINIKISITEGAKIIGFGLQGFPYGTLYIKGTLADPQIDGQIDIARGEIEILGKTFKISKGGIYLKKTNPILNVKAIRTVDDIEIALTLRGTINNPSVLFSATPSIPNDEIIALLVFGKNKNDLSPFQALRLGNALYQLSRGKSGAGGKFDVIGNTERFLDIDHLSINSEANNSLSIGAGKYISDSIYVGTDYNPSTTDSSFLLELKLSETLDLKTRLSNSNQSTNNSEIMLQKRRDY